MRKLLSVMIFVFLIGFVSAASFTPPQSVSYSNYQSYYGQEARTYWPILSDSSSCEARQDILLQVAPGGCQPMVVRSDLLAEQNVPVFCQIMAVNINPLIDVKEIKGIRFTGKYPKEIAGTGFHPARAALRTRDILLGSPITNNIGYVVLILKKNEKESELPDSVNVNLTAQIDYEARNAFGVGESEFLLEKVSDADWQKRKNEQTFWRGQYFLRLEDTDAENAIVSLYYGDRKISTVKLKKGEFSRDIYLPGMYCRAAVNLKFDKNVISQPRARIEISDENGLDSVEVYKGSRFLNNKCSVESVDINEDGETGNVSIRCASYGWKSKKFTLSLKNLASVGNEGEDTSSVEIPEKLYDKNNIEENFSDAISSLEKVADDYPQERLKGESESDRYGELALREAIGLARDYGKQQTEARLLNKIIKLYSDSPSIADYKLRLEKIRKIDSSKASISVEVDNRFRVVRLVSLSQPKKKSAAYFKVGYGNKKLEVGEKMILKEKNKEGKEVERYVLLKGLDANSVVLNSDCSDKPKISDINLDSKKKSVTLCGNLITLDKIEVNEFVKIKVLPKFRGTEGETNLTINVGIEKRAIKLSPEMTKEKVDRLNKSIKKWEGISNNLGKVVTGLKGACFATAGILTFKNFLSGLSGEAVARQKVMQGDSGWTAFCNEAYKDGKYNSLDDCFRQNADNIDKDVSVVAGRIRELNGDIKKIDSKYLNGEGFLGSKSVDSEKAREDYVGAIKSEFPNEELAKEVSSDMSTSELKDAWLYLRLKKSNGLSDVGSSRVEGELKAINDRINELISYNKAREDASKLVEKGYAPAVYPSIKGRNKVNAPVVAVNSIDSTNRPSFDGEVTHSATLGLPAKDNLKAGKYILGLKKGSGSTYFIKNVFYRKADEWDNVDKKKFLETYNIGNIEATDSFSYNNRIKNPEVKYYETEPYKGMPAIVPFDINRGWYAGTRQVLPAFGGIGAFDKSGRVVSFWLCNVGPDNSVDFEKSGFGDDICEQINLQTGQSYDIFPGLEKSEVKSLVGKAVSALNEAARQYGHKTISIAGRSIAVGKSAIGTPGTSCADFMSPKECQLLFNVCDPVICPPSRCDLGGKYPVADVVQTGIVGSVFLCLPNVKEGIIMPVCLTGIKAGIDSYLSVMKSYRDCLQENLDNGKLTGVCDQIYSVYLCEFFWRQVAPVANILLPKLVETAYGQGTRGGGEYMTVMSAWTNMQNSINYFKNSYAVNSLKAFQARSIEEAGGQFCKGFISLKSPKSIKSLLEPDSPPQFYASFSSTKFTTATVPATAHYKVFYHIFAGNDAGVYYNVYLKSAPESSFYYLQPTVQVASGFVAKAAYKSETKDFTAPEGYKELCVRINDKEECGFKQVSTDFAVNYLKDKYVQNELEKKDIVSEKECISGSPGLSPELLTGGLQGGVEESVIPKAYNRGVVRVCGTDNPGKSTDPTRFIEVGYCNDKRIKCWLDKNSVKNAISDANRGVQNETLQNLEQTMQENLVKSGELYRAEDAAEKIRNLKDEADSIEKSKQLNKDVYNVVADANSILPKIYLNSQKAEVLFIIGKVKKVLAMHLIQEAENVNQGLTAGEGVSSGKSGENAEGLVTDINQLNYYSDIYQIDGKKYVFVEQSTFNNQGKSIDIFIFHPVVDGKVQKGGQESGLTWDKVTEKVYSTGEKIESVSSGKLVTYIDQLSYYSDIYSINGSEYVLVGHYLLINYKGTRDLFEFLPVKNGEVQKGAALWLNSDGVKSEVYFTDAKINSVSESEVGKVIIAPYLSSETYYRLNKKYNYNDKIEVLKNEKPTGVYFLNGKVWKDINGEPKEIGVIEINKITLLQKAKSEIGEELFSILNRIEIYPTGEKIEGVSETEKAPIVSHPLSVTHYTLSDIYDPGKMIKVLKNEKPTGVYFLNGKVKKDIDWWFDREIGVIKNNKITLTQSAKSEIGEELFNTLNGREIFSLGF